MLIHNIYNPPTRWNYKSFLEALNKKWGVLGNPKPPDDIMQQLEFMTAVKKKRALDFCISSLRLKLFFEKPNAR